MKLFYISYATETEFLGATVIECVAQEFVLREAAKYGLNPGGQAAILELPYAALEAPDICMMQGRLVGKEEMIAMGGIRQGDLNDTTKAKFECAARVIDQ